MEDFLSGITSLGQTGANFYQSLQGTQQPAPTRQAPVKSGFPVWGWVAIAGGVILVAVLALRGK